MKQLEKCLLLLSSFNSKLQKEDRKVFRVLIEAKLNYMHILYSKLLYNETTSPLYLEILLFTLIQKFKTLRK